MAASVRFMILVLAGACLSAPAMATITRDPTVAAMVDAVSREELEPAVLMLSGEIPAIVGDSEYTFSTRSSSSGMPIDMAEEYVFEQLRSYGLDRVSYQEFPAERGAPAGRNVIGQIDGTTRADEIVIVGAHLDDYPWTGRAPGADDDASGVSATLLLARSFAGRTFERTIRFAFFGDEENAPWECDEIGSAGYAAQCRADDENVVVMIQADSLAYDPPESTAHIVEIHTREPERDPNGGDSAIYALWLEVIASYDISDITPRNVAVGLNWSDHGSFWNNGYPAVMLIEEEWDHWNPNWHTANDTVSTFDWTFYVQTTQSYLALAAHEAGLVGRPADTGSGPLDSSEGSEKGRCGCGSPAGVPTCGFMGLLGLVLARRQRSIRGTDPR